MTGTAAGHGVDWKPVAQLHDRLCLLLKQVLLKDKKITMKPEPTQVSKQETIMVMFTHTPK